MGHCNSGTADFIGECQLEKKRGTVWTSITCTGNGISCNRVVQRYASEIPNGRVKLLERKIKCACGGWGNGD